MRRIFLVLLAMAMLCCSGCGLLEIENEYQSQHNQSYFGDYGLSNTPTYRQPGTQQTLPRMPEHTTESPKETTQAVRETQPKVTEPAVQATIPVQVPDPVQPTTPKNTTDSRTTGRNRGGCRSLTGKTALVILFTDDDRSKWTSSEVNQYINNVAEPGLAFIRQEAARYGVDLDLQIYFYYSSGDRSIRYDGVIDDCVLSYSSGGGTVYSLDGSACANNNGVLERVAINWGFASGDAMHKALQSYTKTQNVAYVVASNKSGWSYARCNIAMEYCFVFPNDHLDRAQAASVFAHEVLHMFGAEDLYKSTGANGTVLRGGRDAMAKRMYPYEIMLWSRENISDNSIGDFTAYTIGWLSELPSKYDCDEWWS